MKSIGIIGATGHFGYIISKEIISAISNCHFILYGRRKPDFDFPNIRFEHFDYNYDKIIPSSTDNLILIIDLSGPVKESDGKSLLACLKNNIPYMDMALHNSHINILKSIYKDQPDSSIFAHFGFFPGLSNLIILKGFEMQNRKSGILVNEFPGYAGGGKNVSLSLKDMLNEARKHKNIRDKKINYFQMHSIKKLFKWNAKTKYFYKWEYPEIESFLYSNPDTVTLERYFSIKPSILNKPFYGIIKIWNSPMHGIVEKMIPSVLYFFKSTLFKKIDPTMEMKFYDAEGKKCIIELKVKSAVKFHGFVMASFVKSFLTKKIEAGLFTPEQIFSLDDILKEGIHDNYELVFHK